MAEPEKTMQVQTSEREAAEPPPLASRDAVGEWRYGREEWADFKARQPDAAAPEVPHGQSWDHLMARVETIQAAQATAREAAAERARNPEVDRALDRQSDPVEQGWTVAPIGAQEQALPADLRAVAAMAQERREKEQAFQRHGDRTEGQTETRSAGERLLAYYTDLKAHLREQEQLGLPLDASDRRQEVLAFAEHWQAQHGPVHGATREVQREYAAVQAQVTERREAREQMPAHAQSHEGGVELA